MKKKPDVKVSEYIASIIRHNLEVNGINCVDDHELDKFEKQILLVIQQTFESLKITDILIRN